MSTRITFDLDGLVEAIESSNCAYQVALYAEHAEVQICDGDSIGQAPQVLVGRTAIASWITGLTADRLAHHIGDAVLDGTAVSFVDELDAPDGTSLIHRRSADVHAGQITQETVIVEARIRPMLVDDRRAPATMCDEDLFPRPRSWSTPARATDRQLAGNFLG